jgi:hypothetical protein
MISAKSAVTDFFEVITHPAVRLRKGNEPGRIHGSRDMAAVFDARDLRRSGRHYVVFRIISEADIERVKISARRSLGR